MLRAIMPARYNRKLNGPPEGFASAISYWPILISWIEASEIPMTLNSMISVIIPVRNGERTLARAIDSARTVRLH